MVGKLWDGTGSALADICELVHGSDKQMWPAIRIGDTVVLEDGQLKIYKNVTLPFEEQNNV